MHTSASILQIGENNHCDEEKLSTEESISSTLTRKHTCGALEFCGVMNKTIFRLFRLSRRKQKRLTFVIILMCFMFFTLFFYHQAHVFSLVYVRPDRGILKQIFSGHKFIEARLYSVDSEFRYPLEFNFSQIDTENENSRMLQPINRHPFRYIHSSPSVCDKNQPIKLLVLVKSAASHFALRNVIRKTWGGSSNSGHYRLAFLLGLQKDVQFLVNNENAVYKDIVQENFIDAYLNNTYKTIMGYNWVVQFCDEAQYVFFVDDDVFVNFDLVLKYLDTISKSEEKNVFSGVLCPQGLPVRDPESKWYIPWHEYPFDFYPVYLAGAAIMTSQNVVRKFHRAFPYVRYLPFDDVFLGIVARKVDIKPQNNTLLDNNNLRNLRQLPELMTNHGFEDPDLYLKTYEKLYGKLPFDYES